MPSKSKLPWTGSKKSSESLNISSSKTDQQDAQAMSLRKALNEQNSKISDLQNQLSISEISSSSLDGLSSSDVKKLCVEVDTANKYYNKLLVITSKRLEDTISERDAQVQQLSQKMQLVMSAKDKEMKRANALNTEDRPLANPTGTSKNIRMAISAETAKNLDPKKLPKIPKSSKEKEFLQQSLEQNQFFRNLNNNQLTKIIDCMEKKKLAAEVDIIKEGTDGLYLYIIETGSVCVSTNKDGNIATLEQGKVFGELALLYNCRRTASVKTKTAVTVYQLDRNFFRTIVQSTGAAADIAKFNLLKSVPSLQNLSEAKLKKICDCMEEEAFMDGDCIIKQGTSGDLFYIIANGKVRVTKNKGNGEEEVAVLEKGLYFGELALQSEEKRAANVYAIGEVKCLSLDRHAFINLIGKLEDQKSVTEEPEKDDGKSKQIATKEEFGLENAVLGDVRVLKNLGQGGFGDVKLVYFKNNDVDRKPYALKCVQKCRIVQYGQQRHIMDEKNILFQMRSSFILSLHKTFKDNKLVYLLTDAYLGGDLWRLLHARGPFPDTVARFYIACVVEAFGYLHGRGIVYRDLKPENLMLHINGYLRLVDLGFAKKVPLGSKTWTFCGTPEYIPPEVIANTGHTLSADYWSLGILVYELLTRKTPFRAKDDLTIYENILRGVHAVQFSYRISRKAEMLIKALCRQEPSERLGYQKGGINDIRKHKWFGGFDWDGFQAQKVPAPILPDVRDPMDNAEKAVLLENPSHVPEETSGWDADF